MIWDKSGTNSIFVIFENWTKILKYLVMLARLERATCCLEGPFRHVFKQSVSPQNLTYLFVFSLESIHFRNPIESCKIQQKSKVSGTNLGQIRKSVVGMSSADFLNIFSKISQKTNQKIHQKTFNFSSHQEVWGNGETHKRLG